MLVLPSLAFMVSLSRTMSSRSLTAWLIRALASNRARRLVSFRASIQSLVPQLVAHAPALGLPHDV